jgi:PleD family two-component response regulator
VAHHPLIAMQPEHTSTELRKWWVKKLRVLIVDDSSVMRKIVERALRAADKN